MSFAAVAENQPRRAAEQEEWLMHWYLSEGECHPYHFAYMRLCEAAGVEPDRPSAHGFRSREWNAHVTNLMRTDERLRAAANAMRASFLPTLRRWQADQALRELPCLCGASLFVTMSTNRSGGRNQVDWPSRLRTCDHRESLSGLCEGQVHHLKVCISCARVQNVDLRLLRRDVDVEEANAFLFTLFGEHSSPFREKSDLVQQVERHYRWQHINRIRVETICCGLQALMLPALVLVAIVQASDDDFAPDSEYFRVNQVVEAVRHFHQRR